MIDLNRGFTALIIAAAQSAGLTVAQTAYVLATAYWETARTMLPVEEGYFLGSRAQAYRRSLRYWPWYGRGFVQLTWQENYIKASKLLGLDFIADPSLALDPQHAAQILVIGSRDGWFTRKRLDHYITAGRIDFLGARRIINGTDRASDIAAIADAYLRELSPAPAYAALRRGDIGPAVSELQRHLEAHGGSVGRIDGHFGAQTDAATRAFQRSAGLVPDGIVGPLTWAVLLPEKESADA